MSDGTSPDELPQVVDALRRMVNDQRERIEQLEDTVERLQKVVDTDMDAKEYDQLTRQDKVREVRDTLVREAMDYGGTARLEYGEVRAIFGNRPSPGHTYDLMELAGEAEGFAYDDSDDTPQRVTVELERVNEDMIVRAANKTEASNPA